MVDPRKDPSLLDTLSIALSRIRDLASVQAVGFIAVKFYTGTALKKRSRKKRVQRLGETAPVLASLQTTP